MSVDAGRDYANTLTLRRTLLLLAPLAGLLLTHGLAIACLVHCLFIRDHTLYQHQHCPAVAEITTNLHPGQADWLVEGSKTPLGLTVSQAQLAPASLRRPLPVPPPLVLHSHIITPDLPPPRPARLLALA